MCEITKQTLKPGTKVLITGPDPNIQMTQEERWVYWVKDRMPQYIGTVTTIEEVIDGDQSISYRLSADDHYCCWHPNWFKVL